MHAIVGQGFREVVERLALAAHHHIDAGVVGLPRHRPPQRFALQAVGPYLSVGHQRILPEEGTLPRGAIVHHRVRSRNAQKELPFEQGAITLLPLAVAIAAAVQDEVAHNAQVVLAHIGGRQGHEHRRILRGRAPDAQARFGPLDDKHLHRDVVHRIVHDADAYLLRHARRGLLPVFQKGQVAFQGESIVFLWRNGRFPEEKPACYQKGYNQSGQQIPKETSAASPPSSTACLTQYLYFVFFVSLHNPASFSNNSFSCRRASREAESLKAPSSLLSDKTSSCFVRLIL